MRIFSRSIAPGLLNQEIYVSTNGGQLGDVNRQKPVTYLFTAWAYYTGTLGVIRDPTPATAYFVVVPAGVSSFVAPQEDTNKQPIKEQSAE